MTNNLLRHSPLVPRQPRPFRNGGGGRRVVLQPGHAISTDEDQCREVVEHRSSEAVEGTQCSIKLLTSKAKMVDIYVFHLSAALHRREKQMLWKPRGHVFFIMFTFVELIMSQDVDAEGTAARWLGTQLLRKARGRSPIFFAEETHDSEKKQLCPIRELPGRRQASPRGSRTKSNEDPQNFGITGQSGIVW